MKYKIGDLVDTPTGVRTVVDITLKRDKLPHYGTVAIEIDRVSGETKKMTRWYFENDINGHITPKEEPTGEIEELDKLLVGSYRTDDNIHETLKLLVIEELLTDVKRKAGRVLEKADKIPMDKKQEWGKMAEEYLYWNHIINYLDKLSKK